MFSDVARREDLGDGVCGGGSDGVRVCVASSGDVADVVGAGGDSEHSGDDVGDGSERDNEGSGVKRLRYVHGWFSVGDHSCHLVQARNAMAGDTVEF